MILAQIQTKKSNQAIIANIENQEFFTVWIADGWVYRKGVVWAAKERAARLVAYKKFYSIFSKSE
jgi:hypothetical protein